MQIKNSGNRCIRVTGLATGLKASLRAEGFMTNEKLVVANENVSFCKERNKYMAKVVLFGKSYIFEWYRGQAATQKRPLQVSAELVVADTTPKFKSPEAARRYYGKERFNSKGDKPLVGAAFNARLRKLQGGES